MRDEKKKKKKKSAAPWLSRDEEAFKREKEDEEKRKKARGGKSVFRQKNGQTSTVVQLDDVTYYRTVHSGKRGGRFYTKTCLSGSEDGILCPYDTQEGVRTSGVFIVGTVLNLTGFTNDDGDRIRNFRQVMELKGEAMAEYRLQRKKLEKKYGSDDPCAFMVWEVRRGKEQKALQPGVHFTPKGRISKKKLIEKLIARGVESDDWDEFLAPADYIEMTRPETEAEARAFLGLSGGQTKEEFEDDDNDDSIDEDFD